LRSFAGVRGRDEFSLDTAKRHLNHASYGAAPSRTIARRAELVKEMQANPSRWFQELPQHHKTARRALASFVGAFEDELAMVTKASAAASAVFASIPLNRGDEAVITNHSYASVAMGARRYARQSDATIRVAEVALDARADQTLIDVLGQVTDRTPLVIIDHISSATARRFPVDELVAALANRDIVIVIDGAHALGALPTPAVRAPNVVWFGNAHKYACAPSGAAVLIAQGKLAQNLMPVIDSWGSELPFPERFDLQGTIDSTGFLSAPHAIETLDMHFGWDRIRRHTSELVTWAAREIANGLGELMDDNPNPQVGMPSPTQRLLRLPAGVASDGPSAHALKERLAHEADCEVGVFSWEGTGFLRLSAHIYNEAEDYEYFIERGLPIVASFRELD